jgi:hypothetical protein
MKRRIQPRRGDCKKGHGLGESIDRRAPLLPQQQEDRRDQRAGVTDADPPDEVQDVEAPADRMVDAPDADAHQKEFADGGGQHHYAEAARGEADPPEDRHPLPQHDGADVIRDRGKRVPRLHRRNGDEALRDVLGYRTDFVDGCLFAGSHGYERRMLNVER